MKKFLSFNASFCFGVAVLSIVSESSKENPNTQAMWWMIIAAVWILSIVVDKFFDLRK